LGCYKIFWRPDWGWRWEHIFTPYLMLMFTIFITKWLKN